MKIAKIVAILGCIILVFGIIFHFQGQGNVGPESSFMYKNPEWIDYGKVISIVGIIVVGIGVFLKFKN
jgi:uncharacterized membrane protein